MIFTSIRVLILSLTHEEDNGKSYQGARVRVCKMYVHVSKDEWLFRGLAIAIELALEGMAFLPITSAIV
ncbi:hypothetical protein Arcpr_1192 [Archaeoglobus profundus DSM 5631]|uniref:Uncharacterized protein n=1 Tax=Archaeoglobus profundus (strain DSM 5631 / JCM 9629 / NBRC 100127 / Av18) TaxID=572546 RepID=D2RDQ0_ARCPA|nr:hypothetical protein Arcpr_1192 [Archaeoglobus profundus DSM 5631]